jgi:hypothetical protein
LTGVFGETRAKSGRVRVTWTGNASNQFEQEEEAGQGREREETGEDVPEE